MTTVAVKKESSFGAMMLVTGSCIGAAMIGLPVLSAATGFLPSSLAMLVAYLFTTGSGLLLLEATLWFDQKVNLLSIAQFTLGRLGKILIGLLFAFLFYSIFVAYLDAGSHLFQSLLGQLFSKTLSRPIGIFFSALVVSAVIYRGVLVVDFVNRFLIIGLILSYVLLTAFGFPHVQMSNLGYVNWKTTLTTLPILFICFGYQNLVPSLTHYLRKNVAALRLAIVVGNLIPLFFYSIWNFVILGLISDPQSLQTKSGMVSELLEAATQSKSILRWVEIFSFFALFTSFITTAVSFVDFLRDGTAKKVPELLLHALVFIPPLAIALSYPALFLQALNFAGGFIDVVLFGIFPVIIVWTGRYIKAVKGPYQVAGGKSFLIIMLLLSATFFSLRSI